MRKSSLCVMMALSLFMALSTCTALAQMNATENNTTQTNITEINATQKSGVLSSTTPQAKEVLGGNTQGQAGYTDVTKLTSNISNVFSTNPSVDVSIINVDEAQKLVQVTNNEVAGSQDLTGWKLVSGGNATYTFPAVTLNIGDTVTIHEGTGNSIATDLYTNSDAPLRTGNDISLVDAKGSTVSTYTIPAVQAPAVYVNPLDSQIQY
jgi:hypothetical protein